MSTQRRFLFMLLAAALLLSWGGNQGMAVPRDGTAVETKQQAKKVTQKDRDKAAARALQKGALNPLMITAEPTAAEVMPMAAAPGDAPRYFSHPNYANSPLPEVTTGAETVEGNALEDRQYATDTAATVFVVLNNKLPDGLLTSFQIWNQANADPALASAGKTFHAYILRPTRFTNQYSVVFDSGQLTMPALSGTASELATFPVANLAVTNGDRLAFYGQGIPLDDGNGTDAVYYPSPLSPLQGEAVTLPSTDFPAYASPRTYSFGATLAGAMTVTGGGIRKFVDTLPGLNTPNNLGQQIPVAVPDTTTYPGSDYYIIELGQYTKKMHSDLPPTTLRGYRQAGGEFHYLGPAICHRPP